MSTKNGISKATNSYVVKTRTDILFTGNGLDEKINYILPIKSNYGVFSSLVISTTYYVRNPLKLNLVFHPSDIFLAGKKADLLSYFDVPLVSRDFLVNKDDNTRIVPEQYLFVQNILKKRNTDYHIPGWGYVNLKYFSASENYIYNNFIFFDAKELGIKFPKRLYSVFFPEANYTINEARKLSKVYKDKPLYSSIITLGRQVQYFFNYYVPYYQDIGLKKFVSLLLHKIKVGLRTD